MVEVETEVEDEEEREKIEDKKAILIAAKGLQLNLLDGEGKLNKERLEERLASLMEMFLAQVDE